MTLLVLELLGDNTKAGEATYTLRSELAFTTATLCAVDVHAPGSELTQSWTKTQTGDSAGGSRTVYSPLYVDIDGLADDAAVRFESSQDDGLAPKTLIPLGDASTSGLRTLSLPFGSGPFVLNAGSTITAKLYYRSVEDGTLGDVVPISGNVVDNGGIETNIGGWSKDARCTLYIDLQ